MYRIIVFFWLLPMSVLAAAPPPLAEARLRWLKGNYAESRDLYAELQKNSEQRIAAAIGLSRAWESEGKSETALQVIDDAIKAGASADLHARRAELLCRAGNAAGAGDAVSAALKLDEDHFAARWLKACLDRDRGEYDKADAEYRWFVRTYVTRNRAGKDIKDPEQLLLVAQAGAENARWHQLPDQFKFILNEVVGDALKADPNFWPAECLAGQLLLEKFNKAEALAAFDKALAINPRCADAFVGKGRVALNLYELGDADGYANRALEINPDHADALLLRADVAWAAGSLVAAEKALKACRPADAEAVSGRMAALAEVRLHPDESRRLETAIAKINPKPARFEFERGKWLDDRRHYLAAQKAFQHAMELAPQMTPADAELGLLALRMGDEDEARRLLRDAFKADPFHVRLSNSLKVLRHLEKYETIKTEHFIVRFDPKTDAILGRILADYLETEYDRLARQFDHRPAGPFVVEAFSSHEMFSGRIIAGPDLHTVAATTGRVLALAAPKAQGIKKPFNWARVVRHELTHIFNLDQSNYLVPHWLTEGLAVNNEGTGRPAEWLRILASRAASNELYKLATLDAGFTHPRTLDDHTLAYCQAQLLIECLTKEYGKDVTVKLLKAFAAGQDSTAAVRAACGVDVAAVEAKYADFVRDFVAKSGAKPVEKAMSLAQLEAAVAKNPDDPEINARLAEQYLRRKRSREAREYSNAALNKDPNCGLALYVRAQLYLDSGDDEKALEVLAGATDGEHPHPQCLRALGRAYMHAGQAEQAVTTFERGAKFEPADPEWRADLARAAKQAGDFEKAVRAQSEYLYAECDEAEGRRDLAKMLLELDRPIEAAKYAREALEIDPNDDATQDLLLTALSKAGRKEELAKWRGLLKKPETDVTSPPKP
jgi:tetratricopeptide (TPR) repeat protein